MSRVLTSSKLVNSVRQRAMIPNDTSTYTDQDILDILNEEIDVGLLSTLMSLNEEHLVTYEDQNLERNKVRYKMPYRSVANKLRDVAIVGGDQRGSHYELSRISLEELADYRNNYVTFDEDVFYVEGNEIVLVQSDLRAGDHIRMYFYLRPNVIVTEDKVGKITSIDRNTGVITVSNYPQTFSNLQQMDFVSHRSPNKILSYDITPTSTDSVTKTMTFSTDLIPEDLQIGDYLCLAEETPVPNLPTEMHPILAQRAAIFILEALGDTEGLANAEKKLKKMEEATMQIIDSRVEGAPEKINPRHSTLVETTVLGRIRRRRRL